jgi:hypothetical protein
MGYERSLSDVRKADRAMAAALPIDPSPDLRWRVGLDASSGPAPHPASPASPRPFRAVVAVRAAEGHRMTHTIAGWLIFIAAALVVLLIVR